MAERYWLVRPDGERHPIDPRAFDLDQLAEQARDVGGRLVVEGAPTPPPPDGHRSPAPVAAARTRYEPPVSAIGPLFRCRFARIHRCRVDYDLDVNTRATARVLGGYYKTRRLVRIYTHDREDRPRPLEELFDTFLHEIAHHLEYTEP